MMDSYSNRLVNTLREVLGSRIEDTSRALVNTPSLDYASYMFKVGRAQGIKEALAELSQIEKNLGRAEDAEPVAVGHRRYED